MTKLFYITLSFFIISLLSLTDSLAQTQKGRFMLGTSMGKFNFGKNYTELSLDVKAGYFIIDNLAIGLTPSYAYTSADYPNGDKQKNNAVGIGPFVRYYFGEGKLKPLLNASFLYYNSSVKAFYASIPVPEFPGDAYEFQFKNKYKLIQAGGGIAYFVNDNISLEGIVNYGRYLDYESFGYEKDGELSISLGVQFFVGK
ncbi:outer membrane beta-barrel protein [Cytophagaceae bacterium YF14B1]|uniref:Outer membrane beta-barrel protein n=1 Tax=Xanthocytophaga flava TaxID=3048013 RepID=A0AAE3R0X9_9BACT|nr:outer membrane beta-barrel protein [Xanthocytophaga flavus]MDJ1486068.1 outer membrane beta-barrel protein [Xanthocytophaga flavus]